MALRRRPDPDPLGRVRLEVRRRPLATRIQLEEHIARLEVILAEVREEVAPLREPDSLLDARTRSSLAALVDRTDRALGYRP